MGAFFQNRAGSETGARACTHTRVTCGRIMRARSITTKNFQRAKDAKTNPFACFLYFLALFEQHEQKQQKILCILTIDFCSKIH